MMGSFRPPENDADRRQRHAIVVRRPRAFWPVMLAFVDSVSSRERVGT
jgi:hypothetical protein